MTAPIRSNSTRALELAREGLSRPGAPSALPERLLVVDAERQIATWFEGGEAVAAWPVSTARAGIGGEAGLIPDAAGLAPHPRADRRRRGARHGLRLARADRRDVARRGARRRSDPHPHPHPRWARRRRQSGRRAAIRSQRYIYLHGTNHEDLLGRPVSHGCVRLSNDHVCQLFDAACARAISCSSRRRKRGRCPIPRARAAFTMRGSAAPA